jgi:hypothetical protein
LWHKAAFRCGANVWSLLEVKRTSGQAVAALVRRD